MSVYGNLSASVPDMRSEVTLEAFLNEAVEAVDETYSIVYEEYCNYKHLMESCTDESEKSVLESKVDLLHEVAVKDIVNKIKELWTKFKNWIKDILKKIFDKSKMVRSRSKDLLSKAQTSLNKAKSKGVNESVVLEDSDNSTGGFDKSYRWYKFISPYYGDRTDIDHHPDKLIKAMTSRISDITDSLDSIQDDITKLVKVGKDDPYLVKIRSIEGNFSQQYNEKEIKTKIKELEMINIEYDDDTTSSLSDFYGKIKDSNVMFEKVCTEIDFQTDKLQRYIESAERIISQISTSGDYPADMASWLIKQVNMNITLIKEPISTLATIKNKVLNCMEYDSRRLEQFIKYLDSVSYE